MNTQITGLVPYLYSSTPFPSSLFAGRIFLLFPKFRQGVLKIIRQRSVLFLCRLDKLSFELR
jgi:hypothetical protein